MLRPSHRNRRLVVAIASVAALAAAIALPASAPARAPRRCTVSMLLAELRRPAAAAGQRYAKLLLTNVTRRSCSLSGYPGAQLLGARNRPLATNVVREPGHPRTVVLRPGQSATTTLHWGVVAGTGDRRHGRCQPTPARIEITPPNARGHLVRPWRNGPVCERGTLDVGPMTHA